MNAVASAISHQSSGSEFAMSDSSMLEFVRDLNGQSRNRLTVDEFPFDIDSPAQGKVHNSSSPESDLLPSYMLTSSSQLMPTSSSSLFNYRTGGNFRKKLTSIGNTLFSKTSSNGGAAESLSDPETSAALVHSFPTRDEPSSPSSRKAFVFSGRADQSIRRVPDESSVELPRSEPRGWLNIDSYADSSPVPLTSSLPFIISDPFLPQNLDEYRAKQKQPADENLAQESQDPPVIVDDTFEAAYKGIVQDTIVNAEGSLPASHVGLSPAEDADQPYNSPTKKLNTTPRRPGVPKEKSSPDDPVCKVTSNTSSSCFTTPKVNTKKEREAAQKTSPEKPAKPTQSKSGFERMREVVKNATSSAQKAKKVQEETSTDAQPEKGRCIQEEENTVKTETEAAEEPPKPNPKKEKGKKEKAKKRSSKPIVGNHSDTTESSPPVRPSIEVTQVPNKSDEKEEKKEELPLGNSIPRPESATLKSALKKPSRPPSSAGKGGQGSSIAQSRASYSTKETDKAAELQFSPFMVSNLAEKTGSATTPQSTKKGKGASAIKEKPKDESTNSETPRTPGNSFFSSLAKLPESLRSGARVLSPMQRLTTLFGGEDTPSHTNTGSESAAFVPREPENTWKEKPTVQSLGDLFSRPTKTSTFDQGGSVGRSADPFTLAKPPKTHKWRSKFRSKFVSSKDAKITKPRGSVIDRDRNFSPQREKKPKGILKTTQQTFPVSVRTEGGPTSAVLSARAVSRSTRRSGTPKKKRVPKKPSGGAPM